MARHEFYGTRLYYCWSNMKARCNRENASGYEKYGAKGISVCTDWDNFHNFKDWALSNGYADNLTIDRINGECNYEPSNCRWVSYSTQSRNTKLIHKTNKTGFRGVCYRSRMNKKYCASIQVDKKQYILGYFDDPKEAARAYDAYVITNNLEHTRNFT